MPARSPVYLDHHATTPVDPRVLEAMLPYLSEEFGNAASRSHAYGWRAEAAVARARGDVAAALGARESEIVFTSGATEANNLALLGAFRRRCQRGRDGMVTLATEHPAVLDPLAALGREGARVEVVEVERDGRVNLERLRSVVDERTAVVSVMAANNEIGVLQPLDAIGQIARQSGAWFHTDAAQAGGRLALRTDEQAIDLLSLSGHKLYGPKGVGVLFVRGSRPRVQLEPLMYGGGHERGLRSGTLPVALIVGFAAALRLALEEREEEWSRLAALRDGLWQRLEQGLDGLHWNGAREPRLPGNLNVSIDGVDIDRLLLSLPELAVSTGSACSSAKPEPSHVLLALGLSEPLARSSLRFGLGRSTTAQDADFAAERVIEAVRAQRAG